MLSSAQYLAGGMSLSLVRSLELLGVKVYVDEHHVHLHTRYVHKPFRRLYPKPMMIDNYAFTRGISIPVEVYAGYLRELQGGEYWRYVELVIAPDSLRDPYTTLRLHSTFLEHVGEDIMRRTACVVQEFRTCRVLSYVRKLRDMGYKRVAVPSDNTSALQLLAEIAKHFEHVHILGMTGTALETVLKHREHVDSVDLIITETSSQGIREKKRKGTSF